MLDIVLPVHNEAASIEATIREIYDTISPSVPVRFVICEDGSADNTKEVLTRVSESVPMRLDMSDQRKGYSRAVIDAFRLVEAPYALALDSDGQCDPRLRGVLAAARTVRHRDGLARAPRRSARAQADVASVRARALDAIPNAAA